MFRLTNLGGTIMWEDEPLVDFTIQRGEVTVCNVIGNQSAYLPVEYCAMKSKEAATLLFLEDPVTPITRIGLDKDLKEAGMKYYDPTTLIRYNKGRNASDHYWVRTADNAAMCYKDVIELARKQSNRF